MVCVFSPFLANLP
uniref:Uncharacterized protein n=1 Tax=Arundo donax TaxID=35708 RepID=A0A0A9ET41_ARUDO